jgi:nucleoside-specific outer membrane channel protein Tsx
MNIWAKLLTISVFLMSGSLFAGDWHNTYIAIIGGNDAKVGADTVDYQTELSFNHASGTSYGDQYFWVDMTNVQGDDIAVYGEWAPRFKLGGAHEGFVKQYYLALGLEFGRSSAGANRSKLYGIGFDLNVPNFAFFQYNLYVRDVNSLDGTTTQSTFAYLLPFKVGGHNVEYGAYIDIVHGEEGSTPAHMHTGQQILYPLANVTDKMKDLAVGFEYQYWDKKYGIEAWGKESNLKWMVRWQF